MGVCKKMAKPPNPPMEDVHTPMTSAMSVGASLPVLASAAGDDGLDAAVFDAQLDDAVGDEEHVAAFIVIAEGDDLPHGQVLLFFLLQQIDENERTAGEAVLFVAVHRIGHDGEGRRAENIGRNVGVDAAFDDERQIDDQDGQQNDRERRQYGDADDPLYLNFFLHLISSSGPNAVQTPKNAPQLSFLQNGYTGCPQRARRARPSGTDAICRAAERRFLFYF